MPPPTFGQLEGVIANIINVSLALVTLSTFIMLLMGGLQYLTAGSDKEGAQKASKTLTYAIAGLVVSLSAWVIINLISNFLGINFSVFNICLPGFTGDNCIVAP